MLTNDKDFDGKLKTIAQHRVFRHYDINTLSKHSAAEKSEQVDITVRFFPK